jgi:hypothetical protein
MEVQLSPRRKVLLEKLSVLQLNNKFSDFYVARIFVTVFTSARQLFLPQARLIQLETYHCMTYN